jgi:type VII secretion-associated protein (TIGR03931 family)
VDAHPPGIFVDFNPTDRRAGRPAVTYREIRPGRDILWTVLVDGDVRICIGCQNAAGRSIAVAAACDDAIRTAQRLP